MRMLRIMRTRGPDDEGVMLVAADRDTPCSFVTTDSAAGVAHCDRLDPHASIPHRIALGHRRFSIIDLSTAAHQPFWSADRQVCVAFNGEIYNYVEVRDELRKLGREFRTDSDTEVLVEAYLVWGEAAFSRFNGFWAMALYDTRRRQVLLARDRIGKAPLYITRQPDGLYWCSEVRGLRAGLGNAAFDVNPQAVDDFIRLGRRDIYHSTFFRGMDTFPAASFAWIESNGRYEPKPYWSLPTTRKAERDISIDDAAAELRRRLTEAVRIRLRADVPVGMDLSGGLDSSTIVALAVAQKAQKKLQVFSVSYPDSTYDELPFARRVIDRYADSINYTVLTPTDDDLLGELDEFVDMMHEPFHDPVILDQRRIWRSMNRMGIRVSLNGAGGDETLAGYAGEYFAPYLTWLRQTGQWSRAAREYFVNTEFPVRGRLTAQARRIARKLLRPSRNGMTTADPYRPDPSVTRRFPPGRDVNEVLLDNMTHWRMNYWLRGGNQLCMSVPLEYRCPFLDYRVIELAFELPPTYLIRDGWFKWILRRAMKDALPDDITWRKTKMGFRYPLSERLPQGKARFLQTIHGIDCPFIDQATLRDEFDALARHRAEYLWRLLSLALWWKRCIRGEPLDFSEAALVASSNARNREPGPDSRRGPRPAVTIPG